MTAAYTTPRQNRRGVLLVVISFLCLLLSLTPLFFDVGYRAVWEFLGLLFGVMFLWLSVRYLFTTFSYGIFTDAPDPLFVVEARQGRRVSEMGRFSLADLSSLEVITPKTASKRPSSGTWHRYLAQIFPPEVTRLVFSRDDRTVVVDVECDEDFRRALGAFLPMM